MEFKERLALESRRTPHRTWLSKNKFHTRCYLMHDSEGRVSHWELSAKAKNTMEHYVEKVAVYCPTVEGMDMEWEWRKIQHYWTRLCVEVRKVRTQGWVEQPGLRKTGRQLYSY